MPSRGWAAGPGTRGASPRSGPASRSPPSSAAFLTTLIWEPSTPDDVPVPAVAWGCAVLISAGGAGHQPHPGVHAGPDAADGSSQPRRRAGPRQAGLRPGRVRRGGEPGLSRLDEPGRSSIAINPAAPQIAISGSIGMWNRAETIVRAWNSAIAAAVAIVGSSRLRVAGRASSSPAEGEERSARGGPADRPAPATWDSSRRRGRSTASRRRQSRGYRHGSAAQIGQGPAEQDPRPLGLRDRARASGSRPSSGRYRRGSRPRGEPPRASGSARSGSVAPRPRSQDPLDRRPTDLVRPLAQGAVALPEGIAERALDRDELAVDPRSCAPARARSPSQADERRHEDQARSDWRSRPGSPRSALPDRPRRSRSSPARGSGRSAPGGRGSPR